MVVFARPRAWSGPDERLGTDAVMGDASASRRMEFPSAWMPMGMIARRFDWVIMMAGKERARMFVVRFAPM